MNDQPFDDVGPTYCVTIGSVKLTRVRGLMFYAVSLFNPLHKNDNLHASIKAIKDIVHPETKLPNIVIHITDSIYAFNFMSDNPDISYADARALARKAGKEWVNTNLDTIVRQLDFIPLVFHWDQWEDHHGEEYQSVLSMLVDGYAGNDEHFREFRENVRMDVDRFVARKLEGREKENSDAHLSELARISTNCLQFVLHENAGYILIGRHIIKDYMDIIWAKQPVVATVIDGHGGLMDGAFRLYPGGHLKSIEWLQKNRKKLPQDLWGAERITSVKIELRSIQTSNANAGRTLQEIEMIDNYKRIIRSRSAKPAVSDTHINKPVGD